MTRRNSRQSNTTSFWNFVITREPMSLCLKGKNPFETMDDIFSLDSSRLIKQQSAPGTPKSIHQHLCELSDFCTGRLALCEKYPKISASHQCILLLAALMMSGYVLGCCPILISMEEKHPRQTQDPQSTHIGKQIFGIWSVEFWQFFVKIFS